ncbi:MAG: pentapeptide repeat-containing protein [Magnetococcales bacterium]|nr:pentapeptide repeat-containing protein [Magnetococcales bacterium]
MRRFTQKQDLMEAFGTPEGTLVDADLSFIQVEGLDLSGMNLSGANLSGGEWVDVNLDGCDLSNLHVVESRFTRVTFRRVQLDHALLQRVELAGCTLERASAGEAAFFLSVMSDTDFRHAYLVKAQFLETNLDRSDFTGADLSFAQLRESSLEQTRFISCDLRGVDFRKTNLHHAEYRHVCTENALYYGLPPWGGEAIPGRDWVRDLLVFDGE